MQVSDKSISHLRLHSTRYLPSLELPHHHHSIPRNCFGRLIKRGWLPSVNPLPTFFNTKNETNFEEYSDDDEEAQVMEDI